MSTSRSRFVFRMISAGCIAASIAACSPSPKVEIVLLKGDATPDGAAQFNPDIAHFAAIKGDYISIVTLLSNYHDVMVINERGGETRIKIESGMTTPTGHTISSFASAGGSVINDSGMAASPLGSYLSINPNAGRSELVSVAFDGEPRYVISHGDVEPGSDGLMFLRTTLTPAINGSGQIATSVSLFDTSGGDIDDEAIYRIDPETGVLQKIVRKGDAIPNDAGQFTGTAFQANAVFHNPYIAENGSVAFSARIVNGQIFASVGLYIGDTHDIREVTRVGRTLPGNVPLAGIWGLDYASNGLLAFTAHTVGDTSQDAVYLYDGIGIRKIMNAYDVAPNGNTFRGPSRAVKVSDTGKVTFPARLYPSGLSGMFVGDGTTLTQIALEGQAAPEDHGTFQNLSEGIGFSISDNGLIAFDGHLVKDGKSHKAIYLYDGQTLREVISTFDTLSDSAVVDLRLAGKTDAQAEAINNDGDVLFKFALADGRVGVAVWRRKGK